MDQQDRDTERLRSLVNGYQVTQAISAMVALDLADRLTARPSTARELSADTQTHTPSLARLLRALTAIGLVGAVATEQTERAEQTEATGPTYELTDLGQLLRTDHAGSLAGWATFVTRPYHWDAWGGLLGAVRTGEGAFAAAHDGESVWAWRERHPDENEIFNRAMRALSASVARRLADTYDFSQFSSVVDLGGGDGTLLRAVLLRHPEVHGVVFDLPHVVAAAPARLLEAGLTDRCEVVGGDFFAAVPAGHDAYVLKSVLHDWDDEATRQILRRVREAAGADARVLVVERTISDGEGDPGMVGAMSDLNMMLMTGGAERTVGQWRALAAAADLDLTGTVDLGAGWSVIEARPA